MALDEEVDRAYPARWIGKVTVTTHDGRTLHGRVDEPKGDPGNTLSRDETSPTLAMNDMGRVSLRVTAPLFVDEYRRNRSTGSFILIEQGTNQTVGAGMLMPPLETLTPEYNDFAI